MTFGPFGCGHYGWLFDYKLKCPECRIRDIEERERLEEAQAEVLEWSEPAQEVASWRLY